MDSPDSETNDNLYRYLGDIADLGKICSLRDAELVKQPLITGRVIRTLPIVKKSKYQIQDILIFELREAYSPKKADLLQFKAIFVHTAARLVENMNIEEHDCLAFCNVKLSNMYTYRNSRDFYSKYIIVGPEGKNKISNVHYKRRNMVRWCQFTTINPEFVESEVFDFESDDEPVSVEPEPLRRHPSDENEIPSTSRNFQISVPRIESDGAVPSTSGCPSSSVQLKKSTDNVNDAGPSKTSNVRNVMSDLVEVFQEQSASRINGRKENSKTKNELFSSSGDYQYVKLRHLQAGTKYNVYGIVRRIVKKPTLIGDKYHLVVNVIDETKTDEFLVTIFAHSLEAFPKITPYCIIRLHRLSVEEYKGSLNGKVNHGHDVLVFDKDDTNITHSTAKKITFFDSDKERVEELKEWGLSEITNFRPFTCLNTLELKRKKVNLRGKVSHVKVFEDFPNVALRIQDGTKCTVPYERLSLDYDAWAKVVTNSKPFYSESEEIDIAVAEADGNFRTLKIGDEVELFNVEVTVQGKFEKTNVIDYLKFHMKGTWENLKLAPSKTNPTKESQIKSSLLQHKPAILSKPKNTLDIVKKRRLFDLDQTVTFENDDSHRNQDKSTNTDNSENNSSETNKRKASVEIEEDTPVCCKTVRNDNHIRNVPISNPQKVIENIIPCRENGPATRNEPQNEIENVISRRENGPVSHNVISEPQNVVENVIPRRESGPVSRNVISEPQNIVENVIPRRENGPVSHNENQETVNHRLNWPQPISEVPFSIKVTLISTSPDIDENSNEQEIMSLVKLYCSTCLEFFSHHEAKWIEIEDVPTAFCVKCKMQGFLRELEDVLTLKAHLLDHHGEVTSAVILRQNAENFLGYTVADICSSSEVRLKVRDVITSYFRRVGREKKYLMASILPVSQGNEIKYHITELKPFVPLPS